MIRVLVSTNRRRAPVTEWSGFFYVIDLDDGKVLQRFTTPEPLFREFDPNFRGGMRGRKGIAVRDDQLAISNHSRIWRLDPGWNLLGIIEHPSCAGIHDIHFSGNSLWVAAARVDLLLQFDLSGKIQQDYYMRNPTPPLRDLKWKPKVLLDSTSIREGRTDFRDPRTHDLDTYDRAHVNAVCTLPNGNILISLGLIKSSGFLFLQQLKEKLMSRGAWAPIKNANRKLRNWAGQKEYKPTDLVVQPSKGKSAVIQVTPDGTQTLSFKILNMTVPSHSLAALADDTIVYLNTSDGEVIHYSPVDGEILSTTKVGRGFLRGIGIVDDSRLVLGDKQELILFNPGEKLVINRIRFTDDPIESVYDVKVLPPQYELPPETLVFE